MAPTDAAATTDSPAEEDSPIVIDLKEIDDRYLAIHREYEREYEALAAKYTEKQKPILEERRKLLVGNGSQSGSPTGTPALKGFWLQALQNHPAMEGEIEEHDEPVLDFLQNITATPLDPDDSTKGFRLAFHFTENPYFENAVLSKEFHTKEECPYREEIKMTEIIATPVKWKPGKDVTVEKVKKAAKGKKTRPSKAAQEEPRPSFFRDFFRSMKASAPLPDDLDPHEIAMAFGGGDDLGEEELVELFLDNAMEVGQALKDQLVPFAIRWYTGEAAPDDDDDSEGSLSKDDDEDDEDDSDEEEGEDERPAKGKKKQPKKEKGAEATKEECKQQ